MIEGKITFDRLARWTIIAAAVVGTILLINRLSKVLLPFFIGWFIAYLLYPLVKFVQYRLRVPTRILSIFVTFLFVAIIVAGVFYFIIPPMIEQFERLGPLVVKYLNQRSASGDFSAMVQEWLNNHRDRVLEFLGSRDFIEALKTAVPKVFSVVGQTASIALSVFASFITLLYTFFIQIGRASCRERVLVTV